MTHSPQGTLTASFFPVAIRYSGRSVAYQLASLLGGGDHAAGGRVAALVIPRNAAERLGDRPAAIAK
ncbi:hypothetical protein SMD20_43460 [Nonomuraea sp. LP-02]|uniref:hypothetical protein n=1 Tax=Nonomuraea sp. LP-02 TaxID=3097960 RepID=UPI002E319303|nr:hypothetical protein [Nonomuraea sp. LP-02]MED7931143.1 hypothetical protein [Nonomuraea sp. LP-02]